MNASEQRLVRRSIFGNMAYSMCEIFLDKINVEINGNKAGDIKVNDEEFYFRLVKFLLGIDRTSLGESYMDGMFDADLLTFFENFFNRRKKMTTSSKYIAKFLCNVPMIMFNMQTKILSKKAISLHYDLGNDLFVLMLDRSMNYSCGYWEKNVFLEPLDTNNNSNPKNNTNSLCETLDQAQMNKMLLIGRKLNLKSGMKVLDIGCGWGYLTKFLAVNFDVHVIGLTISKEQYEYARTTDLQLNELEFLRVPILNPKGTGRFEFKLKDYRDIGDETFDRIVSVGMFEHVGSKNYDEYFEIAHKCLNRDGLFLLHTIGINNHYIPSTDPWLLRYIFPGGVIPNHTQVINALHRKFVVEDWHNFGFCYYRTLVVWHERFIKNWPKIEIKYGERFKRMWEYYLLYCAALFKTRKLVLWQIVLSKDGYLELDGDCKKVSGYVSYR